MSSAKVNRGGAWLTLFGALGLLGVLAMIATDVLGILERPHYNPLSDTISLLAYRRLTGPQDIGLFVLAVGCAACALGIYRGSRRGGLRVVLMMLLMLTGLGIVTLTVSDVRIAPGNDALQVHVLSTIAVGAAILAASLLFPYALPRELRGWRRTSFGTALFMVVLGGLYPFVPRPVVGFYERLVVADGLIFIALVSLSLVRAGQGASPDKEKGPPANREP